MFRRNNFIRDVWGRSDSASRQAASMPVEQPKATEPVLSPDHTMLNRYHSTQYYAPHAQQAASSLGSSGAPPAYARQTWPFDVPTLDLEYPTTPADTPYTPALPTASYYTDAAPLAYPESSQRTLLDDAYSSAYGLSYGGGPLAFRADPCAVSDQSMDTMNHYAASAATRARSTADDAGAYAHPLARGPPSYSSAREQQDTYAAQPNPNSLSPQLMLPMLDMFGAGLVPEQQRAYGGAPHHHHHHHQRRASLDSNASAPSASAVPPLVYDGELGDDYDADSDSPTSAASDLRAYPAAPTPTHPSSNDGYRRPEPEWARPPLEHAFTSPDARQESSGASTGYASSEGRRSGSPRAEKEGGGRAKTTAKKSKMHKCAICFKMFPRPSGLATHMNSHSGAKPFKCPIPTCTKSFAVRSNAKRHLRTHGIFPSTDSGAGGAAQFQVGFETPLVSEVHDVGRLPAKLRWVPQSLASRTNVDYLRDAASAASDGEDDAEDGGYPREACPVLPVPLPPVKPHTPWADERFDERDPYGAHQWRSLPGPAIVAPGGF